MAEFLAMGIPCITNEGVGDSDYILRSHQAGVVVNRLDRTSYLAATDELNRLWNDPQLGIRCRQVATEIFSLEAGVEQYSNLYRKLVVSHLPTEVSKLQN
jgi:glycosyltransferase involved in cell wall biosynthesis